VTVAKLLLLAVVAIPTSAFAQAWTAPAGEGTVTVASQSVHGTGHIVSDGSLQKQGGSRNVSVYVELDYAFTDRLSVSAGIPYVFAKFVGPAPPPILPMRPVDACLCWHSALQDVGITARYNLVNDMVAVTPSISIGVPTHAYENVGEAVAGRGMKEARLAVDAGVRLDPVSPRLALQARYSYAIVEKVLGISTNRSNAAAEVIFRISEAWAIRGSIDRQVTHGGLRAGAGPPTPPTWYPWGEMTTQALYDVHDRAMRDNYWHVGGGLSYDLGRSQVFASYTEFVAGADTHDGRSFTIGLSVPFTR